MAHSTADTPEYIVVQPSPAARRLLLHLCSIGGGYLDLPRKHAFSTRAGVGIVWIRSGHGSLWFGGKEWKLQPEPCFWFYGGRHARQVMPYAGEKLVTNAFWFNGPGVESFLAALSIDSNPRFDLPKPDTIYQVYETMMDLARNKPPDWEWAVHLHLSMVIGELLRSRNVLTSDQNVLHPSIAKVLNAVETDPLRNWRSSDLAKVAGMSATKFRIVFRESMNESPHDYLQRVRMELANEMLADSTLLIKEIAARLHFSSEQYFSSFFHRHTGVSPTEFRQLSPKAALTLHR